MDKHFKLFFLKINRIDIEFEVVQPRCIPARFKNQMNQINIRSDSSSLLKLQVKQGAENMIQSLTSGRDKKLLQEAQQMLDDSRAKIEFLRMRIMKVRQARQQQHARGDAPPPNGETTSNKGTKLTHREDDLIIGN